MLICFWSYILWYFGSDWSCSRLLPPPAVRIAVLFTCLGRLFCASVAFSAASPHLTRVAGVGKHTAHVRIFKAHLKWKAFGEGVWIRFYLFAAPWRESILCLSDSLDTSLIIQTRLRTKKGSKFFLAKQNERYLITELKIQLQKRNINMQFQVMHNDK